MWEKSQDKPPLKLTVSKEQALQRLGHQIEKGRLIEAGTRKAGTYESSKKREAWLLENKTLIFDLFQDKSLVDGYDRESSIQMLVLPPGDNNFEEIMYFKVSMTRLAKQLEDFTELIEKAEEPTPLPTKSTEESGPARIFIVHGRDEAAKESAARLVMQLGLKPLILLEQPNKGMTLIEKLERNAAGVGFVIVIWTPDDIGYLNATPEEKEPRARQNVVFELGFFVGLLRREKVCVLLKGDIERPSDYEGIVYILMDSGGGWRTKVANEIKHAGIEVDLNRLGE